MAGMAGMSDAGRDGERGAAGRRDLLIVDPDAGFRDRLAAALGASGFAVRCAGSLAEAKAATALRGPAFAVLEPAIGAGNGLRLVGELLARRPGCRVVVLTGHGAIAGAVAAIKAGAADYLTKPSDPASVAQALLSDSGALPEPPANPMSADRARWEHIQRVFETTGRNVSETARRLGMHRRTLQRVLAKNPPR